MSEKVCSCGAVHKKTALKLPIRDLNKFSWRLCGVILNSWNGSWMRHTAPQPAILPARQKNSQVLLEDDNFQFKTG